MVRFFDIAGHLVCLDLFENSLWEKLRNLSPFRVKGAEDPILYIRQTVFVSEKEAETLLVSEDEGFPKITVGKSASGKWFFTFAPLPGYPVSATLVSSEDFTDSELVLHQKKYAAFSINNAMMLLYALRTACSGTLEIHASVIVKDGSGVAFLGRSGTGKSTHTRLWLENIPKTSLLNDDNPIVRVMEDGSVRVFGSPWSGKTPCYKKADVPLKAVVRLSQKKNNHIEKLDTVPAYVGLYPSISAFRPEKKLADGIHSTLSDVISKVPCYHLGCLPDADAARLCYKTVYGEQDNI